jgi:reductive dehalogenase
MWTPLTIVLLLIDLALVGAWVLFWYESRREREPRAPVVGRNMALATALLIPIILFVPPLRWVVALLFLALAAFGLAVLIPVRPSDREPRGSEDWIEGEVTRFDERDTVFARNRSVPPGSEYYHRYYEMRPENEERDAKRREIGGPIGQPGRIDKGYRPNVSVIKSAFEMPNHLGPHAVSHPGPDNPPADIDPEKAARIVKNYALHLGAAAAGVCRVDPKWVYSHRGEIHYDNWEEDWGRPIEDFPPYAVVILTEMDTDMVGAGPHTPGAAESAINYAQGAYITTILARWFTAMGYRGEADHSRHYNIIQVPVAVDAGLGELGRQGYLIAPRYGCRVRIFACLTDMPLAVDQPISIGAEAFCQHCKKCAEACPSRSIPLGDKTVVRGVRKWKLDAESCFDLWGKVGTDCSICMGICPFSRPDTPIHRFVRWTVARSALAQKYFPYIDNWLYGKKWKPRPAPDWIDYPRGADAEREVYGPDDLSTFG